MSTHPSQMLPEPHLSRRRNLYVRGFPSSITRQNLVDAFSPYGRVLHCVILCTRDSASRRRAFIVMSDSREANSARQVTKLFGCAIDVSFAVVQRSKGFLDGGDRNVRDYLRRNTDKSVIRVNTPPSLFTPEELATLSASEHPTNLILVSNIPSLLFTAIADLRPLLSPYGQIRKLGFSLYNELRSVIVEYVLHSDAQSAFDNLHGQLYLENALRVNYLQSTFLGGRSKA